MTEEQRKFAEDNYKLLLTFASKYTKNDRGDLHYAFVNSVINWNPERGIAFSTYVYTSMFNARRRAYKRKVKYLNMERLDKFSARVLRNFEIVNFWQDYSNEERVRSLLDSLLLDGLKYTILVCRYLVQTPMTFEQLAAVFHCTKQNIQVHEARALRLLKEYLYEED